MDYYNQYKIDERKGNHLNRITGIVVSVSVFGLVISQSSIVGHLLHFYDNLVLDFKLFTYTTERNCIFLLCNGLLFFIIQSSGLIAKIKPVVKPAPLEHDNETAKLQEKEIKGAGKDGILEEQTGEDEAAESVEMEEEEQQQHTEEREEEEAGGMDVDELNKKCEDFIRKMKKLIQD